MAYNPYRRGYSAGQNQPSSAQPLPPRVGRLALPPGNGGGGNGNGEPPMQNGQYCGLPRPMPGGPAECADAPGQTYCRSHLGASVVVGPGLSAIITLSPVNMIETVARSLHMTATSVGVSPVTFTQAFLITAVSIMGDNMLANIGPVIGSTWAAQMTDLAVFWNRVISAVNPLTIAVTNPDPSLSIECFASVQVDGVKS